jgi:hypothetical protein
MALKQSLTKSLRAACVQAVAFPHDSIREPGLGNTWLHNRQLQQQSVYSWC